MSGRPHLESTTLEEIRANAMARQLVPLHVSFHERSYTHHQCTRGHVLVLRIGHSSDRKPNYGFQPHSVRQKGKS